MPHVFPDRKSDTYSVPSASTVVASGLSNPEANSVKMATGQRGSGALARRLETGVERLHGGGHPGLRVGAVAVAG